nr:hypothetical protein [Tanacetum cinerariifolium]
FPTQSSRSSDAIATDSPYLLVLNTGASQSRQHVDTSLIHIESCKPPTAELFDVDSGRISIHHKTFEISEYVEGKKFKFATAALHGRALTWWNSQVVALGREVANERPWTEVK